MRMPRRTLDKRYPVHSPRRPGQQAAAPATLEGVAFAGRAAELAAQEAGLTTDSFRRRRKSGSRGFTLADVERIAGGAAE